MKKTYIMGVIEMTSIDIGQMDEVKANRIKEKVDLTPKKLRRQKW